MSPPTRGSRGIDSPAPQNVAGWPVAQPKGNPNGQATAGERLEQLVPAEGWWVVYRSHNGSPRSKVAAWAVWRLADGSQVVRPLVAGDGAELVDDDSPGAYLWHDGQSQCHCGRRCSFDPHERDDVCWCPSCAGTIECPECEPAKFAAVA